MLCIQIVVLVHKAECFWEQNSDQNSDWNSWGIPLPFTYFSDIASFRKVEKTKDVILEIKTFGLGSRTRDVCS